MRKYLFRLLVIFILFLKLDLIDVPFFLQVPNHLNAQPKQNIEEAVQSLEFIDIPSGIFNMGCDAEEGKREGRECFSPETRTSRISSTPIHSVLISKTFQIAKYETTQKQWKAVMMTNPSHFHGSLELPVENVTLREVFSFIKALNTLQDGYVYRLPTEAEWEYAARSGDNHYVETGSIRYLFTDSEGHRVPPYTSTQPPYDDFPFGSLDEKAWYSNNSGGHTHPVGQKAPNGWGLHDVVGNVAEWVQDYYSRSYNPADSVDPKGYPTGEFGVVARGGAWQLGSQHSNVWARLPLTAKELDMISFSWIGFRCVREKSDATISPH